MAVLQGKSRENVIRELQRTVRALLTELTGTSSHLLPPPQNLDVNQAVNNLLSRDDDEGEQEEAIAAFLPSGGKCCLSSQSMSSLRQWCSSSTYPEPMTLRQLCLAPCSLRQCCLPPCSVFPAQRSC